MVVGAGGTFALGAWVEVGPKPAWSATGECEAGSRVSIARTALR